MKLTYSELCNKAAIVVAKINAENEIKLRKVETVQGGIDSVNDAMIYRDNEFNEFRVLLFTNGEYVPGADYHTDDKKDARDTAMLMANPNLLLNKALP